MSDSLADASFDEEKYANDSFETEVPESSHFGSENELDDMDELKHQNQQPSKMASLNKKLTSFARSGEFMTCESSSDEDDVVLGETIAEINTEPIDFDDDDEDDDVEDGVSLTPAERIFQMASVTRQRQQQQQQATAHGFPTPPDSKDNVHNDDIIDDDDEDYELSDCDEFETLESEANDAEAHFRKYTKLTADEEFSYEEQQIIFGSGIAMDAAYENISIEDGGEIDVGEPNIGEELGEEEQEFDQELVDEDVTDEELEAGNFDKRSVSSHSETERSEDDAAATASGGAGGDTTADERFYGGEENRSDNKSLRADDSMESFKRRVMLSQRMRCQSEGAGDCSNMKSGRLKSSIPIWTGINSCGQRVSSGRNFGGAATAHMTKSRVSVGSRASLPEFSEKSETEHSEKIIDAGAGGDYSESTDGFTDEACTFDGNSSAYEMELERFLKAGKKPKPPKKLKAGERRNKSFSNERLRDIERSNHILLRKIINQKPTVAIGEKKKKSDKFASLPPTTRLSSAEINRKKQERQIALDNQLFKRKLDAILQRKPKKT